MKCSSIEMNERSHKAGLIEQPPAFVLTRLILFALENLVVSLLGKRNMNPAKYW